jgi:hypothetical protein
MSRRGGERLPLAGVGVDPETMGMLVEMGSAHSDVADLLRQ